MSGLTSLAAVARGRHRNPTPNTPSVTGSRLVLVPYRRVQGVYRTPTSSHVRIHNSDWHGYDYVAPAGVFSVLYGDISNNNGYAARVTVLNGASSELRESQFMPLLLNSVPYNVYGLIRMCTTEKFIYVVDRALVYYKYDFQGTIDCIKVAATAAARSVADPVGGGQSGPVPIRSGGWDLLPPSRQRILYGLIWADGHWATDSIYHTRLISHVGLLKLLSPDVFQELKWSKMRWRPLPQTMLVHLTACPQTP